jgi:hypothetical protein
MRKSVFFLLVSLFLTAGYSRAEDAAMPALPPLPGQENAATGAVPSAQVVDLSQGAPKSAKELEKQRKDEEKTLKEQAKLKEKEAKAQAKELEKINKDRKKQGLPPLEALTSSAVVSTAAQPVLTKEEKKAAEKKAKEKAKELEKLNKDRKKKGLPPLEVLPGEETSSASATLPGVPGSTTPAVVATPAAKSKTKRAPMKKWTPPDFGPNVIFGGWVNAKGGNTDERLAWVSQEVLNTLDFNGFDFVKETGAYAGQAVDRQWREFSFKSRRDAKAHPVYVAVEEGKNGKVWLRVGPSEPPAGVPAQEVRKMRVQNQKVIALMKKTLKNRLTPVKRGWESPYRRSAN